MNIAVDCSECCDCPQPTVRSATVGAVVTKVGFPDFEVPDAPPPPPGTPPARYLVETITVTGLIDTSTTGGGFTGDCCKCSVSYSIGSASWGGTQITTHDPLTETSSTSATPASSTATVTFGQTIEGSECAPPTPSDYCDKYIFEDTTTCSVAWNAYAPSCLSFDTGIVVTVTPTVHTTTRTYDNDTPGYSETCGIRPNSEHYSYVGTITRSEPYTTSAMVTNLATKIAAATYPDYVSAPPTASFIVATNELNALGEKSKYKIRHPAPKVGNGTCYRVEWVERFVPKLTFDIESPYHANGGGASVTSVEVINRGVFRPNINVGVVYTGDDPETFEPIYEGSDGGGNGLKLVAVMSSGGAVASIRILNPGSGYTSAPTITLDGSEPATASAVVDSDPASPNYGKVTSINVTYGGDYLPEITFSTPELGGTQAEATCTLNETGGIATVSVTEAGEFYSSISLSAGGGAELFVHYGTETPRCYKWSGVKPDGYVAGTPSTHPESGEFEMHVPTAEGHTFFQFKKNVCDCSNCP